MTEETKNTDVKRDENKGQPRKRIPLGTRNVLTAPKRPGYVRRFVNDKGDRVERFKEAGYSIVEDDIQVGDPKIGTPNKLGSTVDAQVGGGQRAVLMEIPENFYNEDFKMKQNKIANVENEIRRNSKEPGKDGLHGKIAF